MEAATHQPTDPHASGRIASLPVTLKAGFILIALGGLADVLYHVLHGLDPPHVHSGGLDVPTAIHLIVAAGMVVALGGLVHAGIRSVHIPHDDKEAI